MKWLRVKLTAFNTLVTGTVLLCMTVLCLALSEKSGRAEAFRNFGTQLSTATAYLQSQEKLSMHWFEQLEASGSLRASVTDGNIPLFSVGLEPERGGSAAEQAKSIAEKDYGMPEKAKAFSCVFPMTSEDGRAYYAGVAKVPKENGVLELTLLRPLDDLQRGFARQRITVGIGAAVAVGVLGIFSWGFAGRVLRPVAESQRRQTQFIAAASHELRTPLTSILSAASAMERAEGAEKKTFSQVIAREGDRMGRLIQDMLDLASADSGGWRMQKRPIEPDMLLLECFETYEPQARERGLGLHLQLPENVTVISADPDRIGQALSILVDNALSYTPAPGGVTIGIQTFEKKLRFFVSDTGPGVPDGEKQQIFQRFHRSEAARSDRKHFGLGLSIAAEIAAAHQGRLWVEDAPGGGAVFFLELPRP